MRYSILVSLREMCQTLLEAAQYIGAQPESELGKELLETGKLMISQIEDTLRGCENDCRSSLPLELTGTIKQEWAEPGNSSLEKHIQALEECLPKEINYQVRAVFFAELGEKWDSMESVYTYMKNDPRFDPVVVLTPVFREVNTPSGPKRETIYKDYLTPLGIPFFHYNQYSLEKDKPDLAFISQPYESCTLPQFWPQTIAQHTRLVYLPYYLPDILHEGSTQALCLLPVYKYAWKVVCASEKQFTFYSEHSICRGSNALLTGLPKMDRLVDLQKCGIKLPDGWEKVQGKTVFLWNSWYDMGRSSLQYADALITWFTEHKECCLLWRPHPMTDIVTKLYHPAQYRSFQAIQKKIQRMPNAVLDKETSCEAAFFYSNAQISDYSSLLPQYLSLDKPALWIRVGNWQITGTELIESSWMEKSENLEGIYNFLERIQNGIDKNAKLRKKIRERDLALADGNSGERVCEAVWQLIHQE